MPEMDGYEATNAIHDDERKKQMIPGIIIGLSAQSTSEYKEHTLACGMNDFLIKPVNIENVLERTRSGYYNIHSPNINQHSGI